MSEHQNKPPSKREYPPFYEKIIPIAVGIIIIAMIFLLVVIIGVITRLLPGV